MTISYETFLTDEKHQHLTPYSNSILSAINTCPMWGIIHYGLKKSYATDARAMALEYGATAHELFSACYLYQVAEFQSLPDHADHHGKRLYNDDRWTKIYKKLDPNADHYDRLVTLNLELLSTLDFYDDPYDKVRTVHNLEMGIIKYIDNILPTFDKYPIYIEDTSNPTSPIGVELPIDYCIKGKLYDKDDAEEITARFIGTADRVHQLKNKEIILGENKTASRLDEAWTLSFDMANQITGYLLGLSTYHNTLITKSKVHGLKTRQTGSAEDFSPITPKERTPEMFDNFCNWVLHSVDMYERYQDDIEAAPRYTHSCNRYFRPCSLISFCTDDADGRVDQLEQMTTTDLSPSEKAILEKKI